MTQDNVIHIHSLRVWERFNPPPLPHPDETVPEYDLRWSRWTGRRNAAMQRDPEFVADCLLRREAEKKRRARIAGVRLFAGRILHRIADDERDRREPENEYLYTGA
jgi:hypothetical protein